MSVWRSLPSSMGRIELRRVEIKAASRLHMAPNTFNSSSRKDTRCSCVSTWRQQWTRTDHTSPTCTPTESLHRPQLSWLWLKPASLACVKWRWFLISALLITHHLIVWNQREHILIVVGFAHPLTHLWVCISLEKQNSKNIIIFYRRSLDTAEDHLNIPTLIIVWTKRQRIFGSFEGFRLRRLVWATLIPSNLSGGYKLTSGQEPRSHYRFIL